MTHAGDSTSPAVNDGPVGSPADKEELMHALVAVILPKGIRHREARTVVARTMEPYSQETGQGMWDWYQVGGRFTGVYSGYNPNTDPANSATCDLCRGTGKRHDMERQ